MKTSFKKMGLVMAAMLLFSALAFVACTKDGASALVGAWKVTKMEYSSAAGSETVNAPDNDKEGFMYFIFTDKTLTYYEYDPKYGHDSETISYEYDSKTKTITVTEGSDKMEMHVKKVTSKELVIENEIEEEGIAIKVTVTLKKTAEPKIEIDLQ